MYPRTRLPGIYVETAPRPAAEALPRMDVAVFAGLAAKGPCHRAIAVDSVAAFEAVFGGDYTLAFDPARGEVLRANLASSVRAFFSNGGTRCWAIRLAMTAELAERWEQADGQTIPAPSRARAAAFAMAGLLARAPSDMGGRSQVRPAMLRAASAGAWADDLSLTARVRREAIAVDHAHAWRSTGFSFADANGLAAGDMLEIVSRSGSAVRYAKVAKVQAGVVWALWIACFRPIAADAPVELGHAAIAGVPGDSAATLIPGEELSVELAEADLAGQLELGRWLHFTRQGKSAWVMVERLDPKFPLTAFGRAWRQVGSTMPGGSFVARRLHLTLAARQDGALAVSGELGLCREHPEAVQALVDDDRFYAPADQRLARRRADFALTRDEADRLAAAPLRLAALEAVGTSAFTADNRVALRTGWLPLGLGADFAPDAAALTSPAMALERDGVADLDHRLFLDPRLAELDMSAIAGQAEELRSLREEQLFGIHAAIDIPGDLHSPAAIIAVPDAALPGWELAVDRHRPPAPKPGAPVLPRWRNHLGGCIAPADTGALAAPDWSRFLDCATAVLTAPAFTGSDSISNDGSYHLGWTAGPALSTYVLEEASQPDFADAVEVLRDKAVLRHDPQRRGAGTYYYRLHIELDGNVSAYAAHVVIVRTADFVVASPQADAASASLRRVQVALLRLCAGTADWFAVLSLPRAFRALDAGKHARALALLAPGYGGALQLGQSEQRALSYGALYHPWLAARREGDLAIAAPDGAVAGLYAARAQARGAWIAPASDPLRDVIGLDPASREGDLLGLDQSRVNAIRRLPSGFALLDADTLSDEDDWRQVSTRRLIMLIRRAALERGMTHVFEPNGAVTRRAVERSFTVMLDELQRRGAFTGKTSASSFRIALPESASDREEGRLTVEIAVSPAQPLRFLTVRLAQQGSRLTFAEAA